MARLILFLLFFHSSVALLQYKVFSQLSEGYKTFRIPGIVQSANGTLLAFAEGRVATNRPPVGNASVCYGALASGHDGMCVDKDIVYKRSYDGGASWTTSVVLTHANETFFYSNPNAAVDPRTGRIHLLYARCRVAKIYGDCIDVISESIDNGESFGELHMYPNLNHGIGGPGGGWVVRHGSSTSWQGRVIFGKHGTGILYSDDAGREWRSGPNLMWHGENQIAETSNGSLVMCMRRGQYDAGIYRSDDGGMNWYEPIISPSLINANCQMSVTSFETKKTVYLLLSHPNSNVEPQPLGRQNMTVHYSDDMGSTWNVLAQVYEGPSAYSSIIQVNETIAACLYERSEPPTPIDFESLYIAFISLPRLF